MCSLLLFTYLQYKCSSFKPELVHWCFQLLCSCPLERAVCWREVKQSRVYIQKQTQNLFILTGWYLITVCLLLIPLPWGIVDLHRFLGFMLSVMKCAILKNYCCHCHCLQQSTTPQCCISFWWWIESQQLDERCMRERLAVDLGVEFPQENRLPTVQQIQQF